MTDYTTLRFYGVIRKAVIPSDVCDSDSSTYKVVLKIYTEYVLSRKSLAPDDQEVLEYDLNRVREVVPTAQPSNLLAAYSILYALVIFRGWNVAFGSPERLADEILEDFLRGSPIPFDLKPRLDNILRRLSRKVVNVLVECLEEDFLCVLRKYLDDTQRTSRQKERAERLFRERRGSFRRRLLDTSYFSILDEVLQFL